MALSVITIRQSPIPSVHAEQRINVSIYHQHYVVC